jgi:hypothetical protein
MLYAFSTSRTERAFDRQTPRRQPAGSLPATRSVPAGQHDPVAALRQLLAHLVADAAVAARDNDDAGLAHRASFLGWTGRTHVFDSPERLVRPSLPIFAESQSHARDVYCPRATRPLPDSNCGRLGRSYRMMKERRNASFQNPGERLGNPDDPTSFRRVFAVADELVIVPPDLDAQRLSAESLLSHVIKVDPDDFKGWIDAETDLV